MKVESCVICPLCAEDAKKFKFDHKKQDKMTMLKVLHKEMRLKLVDPVIESEANESGDHGSEASGGTEDDSDF
ncbi:unnamed protein product [Malus baccata var. baccata]